MKPDVVALHDDELLIEWCGRVILSIDDDGFGYAIRDSATTYRSGKYDKWSEAVKEIRAALADNLKGPRG